MDGDLTYPLLLREALAVSRRIGTWVLYEIEDERNIEYVVGYLRGRIADFSRRRARSKKEKTRHHFKERISYWKRAIVLAQRMGPEQHQVLARRIIADIERDPEYQTIPYVAKDEVAPGRAYTCGKLSEEPKRRPGKPRLTPLKPADFKPCEHCRGEGFFRRTSGSS